MEWFKAASAVAVVIVAFWAHEKVTLWWCKKRLRKYFSQRNFFSQKEK